MEVDSCSMIIDCIIEHSQSDLVGERIYMSAGSSTAAFVDTLGCVFTMDHAEVAGGAYEVCSHSRQDRQTSGLR
jgi:hypothetical protein